MPEEQMRRQGAVSVGAAMLEEQQNWQTQALVAAAAATAVLAAAGWAWIRLSRRVR
jgi:hypothetical protein